MPAIPSTESSGPPPMPPNQPAAGGTGRLADEIRSLVYGGIPSALLKALEIIRTQNLSSGEFGRTMNAIIVYLLQRLYPDIQGQFPAAVLPQTAVYMKILQGVDKGIYTAPPQNGDYLEYVLPFLALIKDADPERLTESLPHLEKAVALYPNGVIPRYFIGFVYENSGRFAEARTAYSETLSISKECYPAALGLARLLEGEGLYQDEARLLSDALMLFPDNMNIKRRLATAYYKMEDWSRAGGAIAEILQRNNREGNFLLMYAHALIEQKQFTQAQGQLDAYAIINTNNPQYLFLRARVQAEGFRNRDAALNYLHALRNAPVVTDESMVYMAKLLLESDRKEEQAEGRTVLTELIGKENPSLTVIELAATDAIRREAWDEALPYMQRLLDERRSSADLMNAYTVAHGQSNNAAALAYARELFQKEPSRTDATLVYIAALIDTGRTTDAAALIDARINATPTGTVRARYYYLRSRTRSSDEARLDDLRSSLFEDPRNLQSLIAMFEYYHRQGDRRALYYLKQALAITPDNPQLKRYEKEYAISP
jgi:tetratricopeptide (TPR) repeat protein